MEALGKVQYTDEQIAQLTSYLARTNTFYNKWRKPQYVEVAKSFLFIKWTAKEQVFPKEVDMPQGLFYNDMRGTGVQKLYKRRWFIAFEALVSLVINSEDAYLDPAAAKQIESFLN